MLLAPYLAKEKSLQTGLNYKKLYMQQSGKAFMFYAGIMGSTFGLRQFVYQRKDQILFELTYRIEFLRKRKPVTDMILYSMFSVPAGLGLNYFINGRLLRGTFLYTIAVAGLFRVIDGGNGLWS